MSKTPLHLYFDKIEQDYKKGIATEHTYRSTLKELLETLNTHILATNEPKRVKCGAPDYVVERDNLTIGYIEAKDIGISLDKVEKDEQLGRYRRALDNLILTDYLEFRWYVAGEKRLTARLATPQTQKSFTLDKTGMQHVEALLLAFLDHSAEPIRKPQELAKRMARLAHMIRDMIIEAFGKQEASNTLKDLYAAFQEVLLPDLQVPEFADMFAQTMAYGLFAARYNHTSKKLFSRNDAAKDIPRTNPFLRRLFGTMAGPDLDDEPFVGFVDELAQVLAYTDMDAVLADFGRKTRQEDPIVHFYETFLVQYDPKLREMRGVYYTPEPVVSYIVRSVDHLLRTHFDCGDGLADTALTRYSRTHDDGSISTEIAPRVLILDPSTGTATFLYHVIAHIREIYREMGNAGMWSSYVRDHLLPRLFGFELLAAPYAMAHLKLGMQLAAIDLPEHERKTWAYDFAQDERLGIYLTNTLDEALKRSEMMFGRYISDEANEAAKVKRDYPVMVVLGNPPYSGHSANKGAWIRDLLRGKDTQNGSNTDNYFEVDGQPLGERNPKFLHDDYVKFIRFAQWRIDQTGHGILAFITNHGYLDNPTFRGMRQSLLRSFDDIYVLDLHGNSRKKERSPDGSKDENVFDIQQGVAIGLFVKRQRGHNPTRAAQVYHAHLWGEREHYTKIGQERALTSGKYHWLAANDVNTTEWSKIEPRAPFYLLIPQTSDLQSEFNKGWVPTEIMPINSTGAKTHRDHFVLDFDASMLQHRIADFRNPNIADEEIAHRYKLRNTHDWILSKKRRSFEIYTDWETHFTSCLYRPFDIRAYYHHNDIIERSRHEVVKHLLLGENRSLLWIRPLSPSYEFSSFVGKFIPHQCAVGDKMAGAGATYVAPLYLYPDPKKQDLWKDQTPTNTPGGRRPNLSPTFIKACETKLDLHFITDGKGDLQYTFGPEDIFNYMYAIFHSPTYRARYAEFLKIDFPRLPLTSNTNLFRTLCNLGNRLVELHLLEQFGTLKVRFPISGNNIIEKVTYTIDPKEPEKGRVWINKQQYFEGVPPDVWEFHIGGYQVCHKWLKDRKGRRLEFHDLQHYQHITAALAETITLMEQIEAAIDTHGGWPIQ